MESDSHQPAGWLSKYSTGLTAAAITLTAILLLLTFGTSNQSEQGAAAATQSAASTSTVPDPCADKTLLLSRYEVGMADGTYWHSASLLRRCVAKYPEFAQLVATAEIADYKKTSADPKATARDRLRAISHLESEDPDSATTYSKLKAQLARQVKLDDEAAKKATAAAKRQSGVHIGMNEEEVLASSWGKPRKVNRSVNSYGTREQWVYNGGYLYFKDGVLESVQTSR